MPFLRREVLSRTLQQRKVDLLTITAPEGEPGARPFRDRKWVFMSARVHPGETPAQFIIHGAIDFLTSESPRAKALRANVVFKIVPMLNPDGVVNGNYRCSYLGFDLNRHWLDPSAWAQPEIVSVKNLVAKLHEDPSVDLDFYVGDIHAHSVGTNSFMYGNNTAARRKGWAPPGAATSTAQRSKGGGATTTAAVPAGPSGEQSPQQPQPRETTCCCYADTDSSSSTRGTPPPISSNSTVTPQETPPISSNPTVTSQETPPVSSNPTVTPRETPPISSDPTVTPREMPPISSKPTVTPPPRRRHSSEAAEAEEAAAEATAETAPTAQQASAGSHRGGSYGGGGKRESPGGGGGEEGDASSVSSGRTSRDTAGGGEGVAGSGPGAGVDEREGLYPRGDVLAAFPRMLEVNAPDFSFERSRFDSDPSKEGTGRRALGQLLSPDVLCFTLEVSFYASHRNGVGLVPYTRVGYVDLGRCTYTCCC
ncbi:unnamed protein product [Laminaria digitata]